MRLKHLTFPPEISHRQTLPIPKEYFETEVIKILTGYGYYKSNWDATEELWKKGISTGYITNAFEKHASSWWAPCTCPNDRKPHFGHTTFDGRSCEYVSSNAISEITGSKKTPESIKIEIQRRIFSLVDSALPKDIEWDIDLDRSQVSELLRIAQYPTKLDLLLQVLRYFRWRTSEFTEKIQEIESAFLFEQAAKIPEYKVIISNEDTSQKKIQIKLQKIIKDLENLYKN
jgi:hypothetical protein